MQTIHPIRHNAAGVPSVFRWCSRLTRHHTLFICDDTDPVPVPPLASERERYDAAFLKACGITRGRQPVAACGVITVEIVMQGESVRKAREMHAVRKRKPLLGERHAHGAGELDLGEIS